jgi:uncharacterized membrane protein YphA (DoxX/SURF4 family)
MIATKALRIKNIIYWTGILLVAACFLTSGFFQITKNQGTPGQYLSFGYPSHCNLLLGYFNIAGVVVLLMPPNINWIKEWAFAGFVFELTFAFNSAWSSNRPKICVVAATIFIIVITTYIMFRKIYPLVEIPGSGWDDDLS